MKHCWISIIGKRDGREAASSKNTMLFCNALIRKVENVEYNTCNKNIMERVIELHVQILSKPPAESSAVVSHTKNTLASLLSCSASSSQYANYFSSVLMFVENLKHRSLQHIHAPTHPHANQPIWDRFSPRFGLVVFLYRGARCENVLSQIRKLLNSNKHIRIHMFDSIPYFVRWIDTILCVCICHMYVCVYACMFVSYTWHYHFHRIFSYWTAMLVDRGAQGVVAERMRTRTGPKIFQILQHLEMNILILSPN